MSSTSSADTDLMPLPQPHMPVPTTPLPFDPAIRRVTTVVLFVGVGSFVAIFYDLTVPNDLGVETCFRCRCESADRDRRSIGGCELLDGLDRRTQLVKVSFHGLRNAE